MDAATKTCDPPVANQVDIALTGAELVSLSDLCNRLYWDRLWIVQEVLLAQNLSICWSNMHNPGLRTVSWAEWSRARHTLESLKPSAASNWDGKLRINVIQAILQSTPAKFDRLRETGNQRWPLNSLLDMFPNSMCREPADKIYGLLGLISDVELRNFPIDYNRHLFDTYVEILNCYAKTRLAELPSPNIIKLSQNLQLALNGPIPTRAVTLGRLNREPGSHSRLLNCRGYAKGSVIVSNLTKHDLYPLLKREFPTVKSTWKTLTSKIVDLESCSNDVLKGFNSEVIYATREN